MKKICVVILASMLLLGSCSPNSVEDDTAETKGSESSVADNDEDAVDEFLADLQFEPIVGVTASTLNHTTDITSFKSKEDILINTFPTIFNDDQYTYLIRSFPEEFKDVEEYNDFIKNSERINYIEIFANDDYSEPVEIVTLNGLAGKKYWPSVLSYNSEKDVFYIVFSEKIDDEFVPVYYEFDRNGEVLNRFVFSGNTINPMQCINGMIYTINNNGYSARASNLTVIDPATDERTTLDDGAINFYMENGILYYIKNAQTADYRNVQRIYSYDPATGNIVTVKEIKTDKMIVSFYYDSEKDIVYFADAKDMFVYKDGEEMLVMDTHDANIQIMGASGENLFTLVGINQISLYELADDPVSLTDNMNVLKVCVPATDDSSFEAQASYAAEVMRALGMPIRFEYTYIGADMGNVYSNEAEYVNNMAKKFLAGDTDYDIFLISSTMSELFESKYYEDLSQYSVIMDFYDKMIPGITELCSIDGKLALAPMTFQLTDIIFSSEILNDPDYTPETFDEFLEKYNELSANMDEDTYYTAYYSANFIAPWLDELASNYFAEVISDETAENDLVRLFECVSKLDEYEKIYIGSDYNKKLPMCVYGFNWGNKTTTDENQYIPLPKLSEEYKYSVTGDFLAVNPNSPNKELALKFVAYYLNSIVSGDYTSLMQCVKEGEVEADEKQVSKYVDYETSKYKTFAEQIADSIHKTVAEDLFSFARDLCIQIEDGTVTPEEAASRTLRYLKMMRDE